MSLNQDQIDIISNSYLTSLYDDMEQQVIADIARRVLKTGRYTETAEIMARNMREQGYSTAEILKEVNKSLNKDQDYLRSVAENTKEYKQMIKQVIAETEEEAKARGDMLTAMAGDMAWNDDMQMWSAHNVDLKKDNSLKQLTDATKTQLNGDLMNITGTGNKSKGTLQCGGTTLENAYKRQMDLAVIKMCTGNFSYNQAVKDCVQSLARQGVTVRFAYKRKDSNGKEYTAYRNYHLDTAVRMCVRTASTQLAGKVSEMNMDKTGQDLVYVDAHAMSRPEHAVWQGKVYVWNKDAQKKYPQYADFWSATDYGSVTGLKGVNCSHNFYPYWPGDVIPEFKEPEPVEIDGKIYTMYEATQEQRAQERDIRALQRERDAAQAIGDSVRVKELNKKINLMTQKYTAFSNKAGLRPKYERINSTNWTKTDIKKAIANAGQQVHNSVNSTNIRKKSNAFDGLVNALGQKHVDAMNDILANCGNQDIISMFEKNSGVMQVGNTSQRGTAFYSPTSKKVYFDLNNISGSDDVGNAYQTAFHEFAHNIDHALGGNNIVEYYSVKYKDASGQTLYDVLRNDLADLRTEAVNKYGLGKVKTSIKDDYVAKMLQDEVTTGKQMASVSDTLESVNGKRLTFKDSNGLTYSVGHGSSYWNQGSGKASQASLEFFAKYTESVAVCPESEAFMRRAFPHSMRFMDEMIKVI